MYTCEKLIYVVNFIFQLGQLGIKLGIIYIDVGELGIHVTLVEVQIFVIVVTLSINFDI